MVNPLYRQAESDETRIPSDLPLVPRFRHEPRSARSTLFQARAAFSTSTSRLHCAFIHVFTHQLAVIASLLMAFIFGRRRSQSDATAGHDKPNGASRHGLSRNPPSGPHGAEPNEAGIFNNLFRRRSNSISSLNSPKPATQPVRPRLPDRYLQTADDQSEPRMFASDWCQRRDRSRRKP